MEVVISAIFFQLNSSSSRFVPELLHYVPSSCSKMCHLQEISLRWLQIYSKDMATIQNFEKRQLEATTLRRQKSTKWNGATVSLTWIFQWKWKSVTPKGEMNNYLLSKCPKKLDNQVLQTHGSLEGNLSIWVHTRKLTANTPENRHLEREVPIQNQNFQGSS